MLSSATRLPSSRAVVAAAAAVGGRGELPVSTVRLVVVTAESPLSSVAVRSFSSSGGNGDGDAYGAGAGGPGAVDGSAIAAETSPSSSSWEGFRPRRSPHKEYRPIKPVGRKVKGPHNAFVVPEPDFIQLGSYPSSDPQVRNFGPFGASSVQYMEKLKANNYEPLASVEEELGLADYLTSEPGSLHEHMGERRALALTGMTEEEREEFIRKVDELVEKRTIEEMDLDEEDPDTFQDDSDDDDEEDEKKLDDQGYPIDDGVLINGEW